MEEQAISLVKWPDLVVIVAYLVSIMMIGRYFARRQRDTEDFYLGGRQMPWMAVGLSVVASLASTVGYLGDPGEVIRHGIGLLMRQAGIPFAALISIFVIVPFFRRVNVATAFEVLRNRFGRPTEILGVLIWAYMQVAFLGIVLLLASRLIGQMLHIEQWTVIESIAGVTGIPVLSLSVALVVGVIGAASLLYTSAGGMKSVVWTDVIQFCILASGALITLGVVWHKTGVGPIGWWYEVAGETHKLPPLFSWNLAERHTVVGAILFTLVGSFSYNTSEQVVVQRYYATERAKIMMLANYVAGVAFTLVTLSVGAALLTYFNNLPEQLPEGVTTVTDSRFADRAFPYFIETCLPVGLTGLVIAALLGAAQSTIDSGLNSLSAVLSRDILPLFKGVIKEGQELRFARWSTRLIGIGVLGMAILADNLPGSNNIIDLAQKVVHLGLGPMGAVFLIAMFFHYVGQRAVIIGLLTGFLMTFGYAFDWFSLDEKLFGRELTWTEISPLLLVPGGFLVTVVVSAVLGLIFSVLGQAARGRT